MFGRRTATVDLPNIILPREFTDTLVEGSGIEAIGETIERYFDTLHRCFPIGEKRVSAEPL